MTLQGQVGEKYGKPCREQSRDVKAVGEEINEFI